MIIKKMKLTTILFLGLIFTLGCVVMSGCGNKKTDTNNSDGKSVKVEKPQPAQKGHKPDGNDSDASGE